MAAIQVGIVMGSDSDLSTMSKCTEILEQFGIPYYMTVASAHRTPERVTAIVKRAEEENWKVIIAAAGMAAHLAGFVAAHTTIPVIGVPMSSSDLNGLDALLSTVQMPGGVPVATMGLGSAGATNAGILAVQILATSDPSLKVKLRDHREQQKKSVLEMSAKVEEAR